MRLITSLALCAALSSALAGCVTATSRSNKVVVTGQQAVIEGCTRLGLIDGDAAISDMLLLDRARDAAMARLKQRAAELGASHVLTVVADPKWKGPDTGGTAYLCRRA